MHCAVCSTNSHASSSSLFCSILSLSSLSLFKLIDIPTNDTKVIKKSVCNKPSRSYLSSVLYVALLEMSSHDEAEARIQTVCLTTSVCKHSWWQNYVNFLDNEPLHIWKICDQQGALSQIRSKWESFISNYGIMRYVNIYPQHAYFFRFYLWKALS